MQGAVLYGARDVRFEERDTPRIIHPTDAIIRSGVGRSTRARSSTSPSPSPRWRRVTERWTSAARSRRCCARSAETFLSVQGPADPPLPRMHRAPY
jgi:hypothetical protein